MHDCASILDRMYRTYQLNYRSFNEDDEIAVLPISKPHSDTSIFHIYSVATMMMYTLNSFCGWFVLHDCSCIVLFITAISTTAYNNYFTRLYTVEPPNKGHFGNGSFVLSSEVVPISEVHCILLLLSCLQCLNCCKITFMLSVSESNSHVVLSVLLMHA